MNDKKQCEICPWPLDCSAEMKADKPKGADCPREVRVWDWQLADNRVSLADTTPLERLAETEKRELILV
jgi:hypothetical protein